MPRSLTIPIRSGSEPEPIEIDDVITVYEDDNESDLCDKSPSGHHEYSMADGFTCCIHCGKD